MYIDFGLLWTILYTVFDKNVQTLHKSQ